jgi:hypothetical protein
MSIYRWPRTRAATPRARTTRTRVTLSQRVSGSLVGGRAREGSCPAAVEHGRTAEFVPTIIPSTTGRIPLCPRRLSRWARPRVLQTRIAPLPSMASFNAALRERSDITKRRVIHTRSSFRNSSGNKRILAFVRLGRCSSTDLVAARHNIQAAVASSGPSSDRAWRSVSSSRPRVGPMLPIGTARRALISA